MSNKVINKILLLVIIDIIVMSVYVFVDAKSEYILNLRMQKMFALIVVCFAIGYSTTIFQTVSNNPILTPSIMGLESLYMFLQTLVIFLFGSHQLQKMSSLNEYVILLCFMIVFSLIIYVYLFNRVGQNVHMVILLGLVLNGIFASLTNFMQILLDPNEFLILQGRIFTSFNAINYTYLTITTIILIGSIIVIHYYSKTLDVLSLGKKTAISLGVDYNNLMKLLFVVIALLVSVSTILVGPLTFLGIIVISITRKLLATYKHHYLTLGSALFGIILVTIALLVMERLLSYDTSISVVINFVGGIYFMYLLIKERKS